jgi:hypothetical protein
MKKQSLLFFFGMIVIAWSCQKDNDTTDSTTLYGTWAVHEICTNTTYGTTNYHVEITKDNSSSTKVDIDNFFNLGLGKSIKATVSGKTLTITNAVLEGMTFNGTGTVSSNNATISWQYTFDEGNGNENVTATYTKQ